MGTPNSVEVSIRGRTYRLIGADAARARQLASLVDQTMARLASGGVGADDYQRAILTAFQFADDLMTAQGELAKYRENVGASAGRILDLLETSLEEDESEDGDA